MTVLWNAVGTVDLRSGYCYGYIQFTKSIGYQNNPESWGRKLSISTVLEHDHDRQIGLTLLQRLDRR